MSPSSDLGDGLLVDKGHAIKAKRAEKKARGAADESADPVAHITKKNKS